MSHYALLVIGENVEEQLKPFDENLDVEFVDTTQEKKDEYEEGKVNEWYCSSNSSWGMKIAPEYFELANQKGMGDEFIMNVERSGLCNYYEKGGKYKCHFRNSENEILKTIYLECVEVIESTHPNPKICFKGRVLVKKIKPPKEISLKSKYKTWEDFLSQYHGYSEEHIKSGKVGYFHNPNAKWDWYQIGGRYRDRLVTQKGKKGDKQEQYVGTLYKESQEGRADEALKGDCDWLEMHQNEQDYKNGLREWELCVEDAVPRNEEEEKIKKWAYKTEYYIETYKNKETYAKCCSNFTMWAILKDGVWYEKGEMGWWGCSGDSPEERLKWELGFYDNFIKDLPDDTLLTVVDCHI